ncbi:MAG: cob(I)yrinic acid a,c-diamide adenosyltransferase [Bacteroidales bacterium]|nr:cob(I)yrinic acid a,c-diamide adenosyltransferase [Bacteroidales bacterium]
MKVYTKTGDKGTTSLVGGKRVPKNHPRVEAYGDVDELISYLGVVLCDTATPHEQELLLKIQKDLMLISAHFASDGSSKKMKCIGDDDITLLESEIDAMTSQMPPQIAFILPGNPRVASECHVARTICRRAERHALAIAQEKEGEDLSGTQLEIGIRYLNRLSDYLFTLGRFFCHINGVDETFWLP